MPFETKDWISIYAAVLSTFLGTYGIYKEYRKKKGKIIFHYEKGALEETENRFVDYYILSAVNMSETTRVIRKINYEQTYNDGNISVFEDEKIEYPIKLAQYEQYKYKFSAETHEDGIMQIAFDPNKSLPPQQRILITRKTVLRMRIIFLDTTGKLYKTKWLNLNSKPIGT